MPILTFCFPLATFLATITFRLISRSLSSRHPHKDELAHAIEILPRIHMLFPRLLELTGNPHTCLSQVIAQDIRKDCVFLTCMVYRRLQFPPTRPPAPDEARYSASAVLSQVHRLDRDLRRLLLLTRRRSDCTSIARHLTYASIQHTRVWTEYLRFLRDSYPGKYPDSAMPDKTQFTFTPLLHSLSHPHHEEQSVHHSIPDDCLPAK